MSGECGPGAPCVHALAMAARPQLLSRGRASHSSSKPHREHVRAAGPSLEGEAQGGPAALSPQAGGGRPAVSSPREWAEASGHQQVPLAFSCVSAEPSFLGLASGAPSANPCVSAATASRGEEGEAEGILCGSRLLRSILLKNMRVRVQR